MTGARTLASSRLARLAQRSGATAANAGESGEERCELCGETIAPEHRHLLDLEAGELRCTCRSCSLLFDRRAAARGNLRLVGDRRLRLVDFEHPTVREAARFLLAVVDGEAVGCCAVQPLAEGDSELKRMYVVPALRGHGIAGQLMADAERLAVGLGCTRIKLETGVRQPEAIAVYERAGFVPIPTYPPYDTWDLSVCYAKPLHTAVTAGR